MKTILILLVLIAGAITYNFYPESLGLPSEDAGTFNADGTAKAVLFVHADCGGPCDEAVTFLQDKKMAAEIVDVKGNAAAEKQLRDVTKGKDNGVPVLAVGSEVALGFHQARYRELMFAVEGEEALDWPEQQLVAHHFDAEGEPKVVMYGTSWCEYCAAARKRFGELGIEFDEWDVESDSDAQDRFNALRAGGYPLIYIGLQRIGTFDEDTILETLEKNRAAQL